MNRPLATVLFSVLPLACLAWTCDPNAARPPAAAQDQDTPTPRVRLSLGGALLGRLEPCGCASGQMGGLARRIYHLQQFREQYELRLEGGNLVAGTTTLDLEKLRTALDVLDSARYAAVALGQNELALPRATLGETFAAYTNLAVIASDVVPVAEAGFAPKPFFEAKTRSVTVRVASFVNALPAGDSAKEWRLLDAKAAWQRALAGAAPGTLRVLYVHGSEDDARRATTLEPKPDLVVAANQNVGEPHERPDSANGVPVVFTGIRGRMLVDATLTRAEAPQLVRYQVVRLADSETAPGAMDDKDTKERILAHRELVKALGLLEEMAERLPTKNGATYVGSTECKKCHPTTYAKWLESKHAHAFTTLQQAEAGALKNKQGKPRYGWPVTAYPDCVGCHVVGYGQKSGFVNATRTPDLMHVGCEQCHGAGSAHVQKPVKETIDKGNRQTCNECHDFEQSPDFDYAKRWEQIKHPRF